MEVSTDHKRSKSTLTLDEKIKQIDRTKFDALEYAAELLRLIFDVNKKTLPNFEQLQLIEHRTFRYYWVRDREKAWADVLKIISDVCRSQSNGNFRQTYCQTLLQTNQNEQKEIERLLQIPISD